MIHATIAAEYKYALQLSAKYRSLEFHNKFLCSFRQQASSHDSETFFY